MSTYASSISTESSLPTVSFLSFGHFSPISTRSNAGWGSPNDHHGPTPPPDQMEPASTLLVTPPPILSVDVPISAHHLCEGSLEGHHGDMLHSLLYASHLHRTLKFHLEDYFTLWSITRIYLQNQ